MLDRLFVWLQYCVPQHFLSRLAAYLAECEWPWLKSLMIKYFIKLHDVAMHEAAAPESSFASFNQFFVRELKVGARPICEDTHALASPADGAVSQVGDIDYGNLFQAKGHEYSLTELLGGDEYLSQPFMGGKFATIYLAPKDYHRVHMPFDGQLQTMVHVPGDLFSVNAVTAANVPRLFARNERVVAFFDTSAGPMAVVLVGAMLVAGIETVWAGQVTPVQRRVQTFHYPNTTEAVQLSKGDELGRFKFGSTVILVFGPDMVKWSEKLKPLQRVQMGEEIGMLING